MNPISALFELDPPGACQTYQQLREPENPRAQRAREHCEYLWRNFHDFADGQFLTEFPLHIHERWFEMYLGVRLLQAGARLQRTAPPGPDLLVDVDGHRVWVEAVCGTAGEPGRPDSIVVPAPGDAFTVPWDLIALRIRNSIEEKKRKYDRYLAQKIVTERDSLLIALNVSAIPFAAADSERYVFRALFGVGNQVLIIDRKTQKAVDSTNEHLATVLKLASGAAVGVQPFIDGSMPMIAGAIVSNDSIVSAAHQESPVLTLYPNLTPTSPWPIGALPITQEWNFEPSDDGWKGELLTN